MGNVIPFTGITKLDTDPDRVLESAVGKLQGVVIAGYDEDGTSTSLRRMLMEEMSFGCWSA